MDIDIASLKRTELLGETKSTVYGYCEGDVGDDDEAKPASNSDEAEEVEWWQHYGFISRPPKKSEVLLVRLGRTAFSLASRALASVAAFGQLSEGDVGLYSIGNNLIKLSKDGSITAIGPKIGGKQSVVHLSGKDGSLKAVIANGLTIEVSEKNGIVLNAGTQDITLAGKNIQLVGSACNINCGSTKLHMAGAKPIMDSTLAPVPNVFA